MIQKWYPILEFIAITLLFCRVLFNLFIRRKSIENHVEVIYYIFILLLNNWGHIFLNQSDPLFRFYHAFAPLGIVVTVSFVKKLKLIYLAPLALLLSLINLILYHYSIYLILYITAIYLLIFKANKLAKLSSHNIQKSVIYIILAIDLMFSMSILILRKFNFDWQAAQLIVYMGAGNLIVFTTTIVALHVQLRRFFNH
jgi:hypothetical protein